MENSTRFDLNSAVQRWRENLSQSPEFRADNVQELESHLRDSISAWQGKGLSDDEAFLIATRRLGAAQALESEFAKVNGKEVWLDRLLWMAVGVQLFGFFFSISGPLADAAVFGGLTGFGYHFRNATAQGLGATIIPGVLLTGARLMTLTLTVLACWSLFRRKGERLSILASQILRRPFFIGLTVVLGSVLLGRFVSSFHLLLIKWFPMGEYAVVGVSMSMAGICISLVTAITLAALTVFLARRRLRLRTIL